VPIDDGRPPQIPALILGRDGDGAAHEVEVELFWKLNEETRDRVRLIAVRMLQSDSDIDITSQAVARLDTYLSKAMPAQDAATAANQSLRNFLRLNLIIDAAEETGLRGSDVFQTTWEANIVASPEDRSTPDGIDAPPLHPRLLERGRKAVVGAGVNRPERYFGWALSHVATSAGIWAGLPKSVYDVAVDRPAVGYSMVLVQRVFVRGIISDGLAIDLSLETMREAVDRDPAVQRDLQDAMRKHHVEVVEAGKVPEKTDSMHSYAETELGKQGFSYNRLDDQGRYKAPDVSLGSRIGLFFGLLGRGIINIPRFIVQLFLRRLSSKLSVEGGDANVVAEMSWRGGLPTIDEGMFTIPALSEQSAGSLKPAPQLWRELRLTLLAAADASDPGDNAAGIFRVPGSGDKWVLPSRTDIIPNPNEPWTVPSGFDVEVLQVSDLEWSDADDAMTQLAQLDDLFEQLFPRLRESRSSAATAQAAFDVNSKELAALQRQESKVLEDLEAIEEECESTLADHPHTRRR
jgi:hypothetical protein